MFGAVQLKEDGKLPIRVLYVLESPFACMKFSQLDLPAVATFGWSVSKQQADIISQVAKGIVFLCDRDKYGQAGSAVYELAQRMWIRCPSMPEGVDDPEQLTREQILALT